MDPNLLHDFAGRSESIDLRANLCINEKYSILDSKDIQGLEGSLEKCFENYRSSIFEVPDSETSVSPDDPENPILAKLICTSDPDSLD